VIETARAVPGLRRLATGLIAYGVIGLFVAVVGLVALTRTADRLGTVAGGLSGEVERLGRILDRTAVALDGAASTADGFSATVDRTGPTVRRAASAVAAIGPRLRQLEAEANGIAILGTRPLAGIGGLFGEIAVQIDGLDAELTAIADQLTANQDSLADNAASLGRLAGEVRSLEERLTSEGVVEGFDDVEGLVLLALGLFVAWSALPALAALGLGIWLRRLLVPRPVDVPRPPTAAIDETAP
jgi:hypothetical protein